MTIALDTYCRGEFKTGRYARGNAVVAQNLFNMYQTEPGQLPGGEDDKLWGFDLIALVGTGITPAELAALPQQIENAASRHEMVQEVTAEVLAVRDGAATELTVTIDVVTGIGPFQLVLGVSELTVTLLGFSEG